MTDQAPDPTRPEPTLYTLALNADRLLSSAEDAAVIGDLVTVMFCIGQARAQLGAIAHMTTRVN